MGAGDKRGDASGRLAEMLRGHTMPVAWQAGMWLKAHRIEQSRFFKALITLPWVASGRRSGQCRGGSGKAGTCGARRRLARVSLPQPRGRPALPGEAAGRKWHGATHTLHECGRRLERDEAVRISMGRIGGACLANEKRAR